MAKDKKMEEPSAEGADVASNTAAGPVPGEVGDGARRPFSEDQVARGIALGTLLIGAYFVNEVMSEEVEETREDGTKIIRKKGPIQELLE